MSEKHHHRPHPRQHESANGVVWIFFGLLVVAAVMYFWVTVDDKPPGPLPPEATVTITYPTPEGCVTCEEPTSQPATVSNPTQIVQGECTPLVGCVPRPDKKPAYEPTPNPYIPPEHNPLVPHENWGMPKAQ